MAEKLAISGGTPILKREDYRNWPVITEDDRRFVNEVLDSGIVAGATGPQVVGAAEGIGRVRRGQALPDDRQRHGGAAHGPGGRRRGAGRRGDRAGLHVPGHRPRA